LRIRVLPAIHFDNELSLTANEIAKVRIDRRLSHKFVATILPGAQMLPKFRFGVR
jgi:hypothetical protein